MLDSAPDDVFDPPPGRCELDGTLGVRFLLYLFGGRQSATSNTGREFQLQQVADFITGGQNTVKVLLGVGGRNTKTSSRGDQWGSRVADNHNRDLALEHLVGEGGHLSRVEKKNWDDWRVIVTVYYKSKTLQSETEVSRVERQTLQTLLALTRDELGVDDAKGGGDLGKHRGGGSLAVENTRVGGSELVNYHFVGRNVSAVGAERLRESTHHDIQPSSVDAKVIADTTALGADGTDGMGLIDEKG